MHKATNNSHLTKNRQRNGTLLVGVLFLYSVDMITMILLFLQVAMRQTKEKLKMQDGSSPSDELVVDTEGTVDMWRHFYGVCAIPRLDFIFSSLLERWLLLDSSSSTLSSADRNSLCNFRFSAFSSSSTFSAFSAADL